MLAPGPPTTRTSTLSDMKTILLLLCFVGAAAAQQADDQSRPLALWTDGLYTRYAPNVMPETALYTANNILLDEDVPGAPVRRAGYARCNTSAIGGYQIRGTWDFKAPSGIEYQVALASATFYEQFGDCNFKTIAGWTGYSATKPFQCAVGLGALWCANGDSLIYWTGISTANVTSDQQALGVTVPKGNLIDIFRNRVVLAGDQGNRSTLFMSGELDGTDWILGVNSTSPAIIPIGGVNDGDAITCTLGSYNDAYYIGKGYSLWALYGFSNTDFELRQMSREVGCLEQGSAQEKQGSLYWMSHRGVEKMNGANITRASDPIKNDLSVIINALGNTVTLTDSSEADFDQGNYTPYDAHSPTSGSIFPGNLVMSTAAFTVQSTMTATQWASFLSGSLAGLSTDYADGSLFGLDISTSPLIWENFANNEFVNDWYENGGNTDTNTPGFDFLGGQLVFSTQTILCVAGLCAPYYVAGVYNYYQDLVSPSTSPARGHYHLDFSMSANGVNMGQNTQVVTPLAYSCPYLRYYFNYDGSSNGYYFYAYVGTPATSNNSAYVPITYYLSQLAGGVDIILSSQTVDETVSSSGPIEGPFPYQSTWTYHVDINVWASSITVVDTNDNFSILVATFSSGESAMPYVYVSSVNPAIQIRAGVYSGGPYQYECAVGGGFFTSNTCTSRAAQVNISTISIGQYNSSGAYTSPVLDTGFTRPWGGLLQSTYTVVSGTDTAGSPSGGALNFQIRSSSSATGAWEAWSPISVSTMSSISVGNADKRYWQWQADFTDYYTTGTITVSTITLNAETTGYYISSCKNPGAGMTSWSYFTANTQNNGGSVQFWTSTGTTCNSVTSPTGSWVAQSNGPLILNSTAPYIAYRTGFTVDSGTETPTINDVTVAWNEGVSRPPVTSVVYNDRYHMFYTTSTNAGAYNDHALVLDQFDKWVLWDDIHCYSASLYGASPYCGSSLPNGYVYALYSGTSDDGNPFTSSIVTPAYSFGLPDRRKTMRKLWLDLEPNANSAYNINVNAEYYVDRSTTPTSLGFANLNENGSELLNAEFPFPVIQRTTGKYFQFEFDVTGDNSPFKLYGAKVNFHVLRED